MVDPKAALPPAAAVVPASEPKKDATSPPTVDVLATIREEVHWRVDGGYDSPERIVDRVAATAARNGGGDVRATVRREVDASLAQHAKAEAGWSSPTDCDKLDRVFAALEREGILPRPHLADTAGAADASIAAEAQQAQSARKKVVGWVYFHEGATRTALRDGKLFLFFRAEAGGDAAAAALATVVEARLKANGFTVDWPNRGA